MELSAPDYLKSMVLEAFNYLSEVAFFGRLDETERLYLASNLIPREVAYEEHVVRRGDPAEHAMVLISGALKVLINPSHPKWQETAASSGATGPTTGTEHGLEKAVANRRNRPKDDLYDSPTVLASRNHLELCVLGPGDIIDDTMEGPSGDVWAIDAVAVAETSVYLIDLQTSGGSSASGRMPSSRTSEMKRPLRASSCTWR